MTALKDVICLLFVKDLKYVCLDCCHFLVFGERTWNMTALIGAICLVFAKDEEYDCLVCCLMFGEDEKCDCLD